MPPIYPAAAKSNHVAGDVTMDALIDSAGNVKEVKVISGPPLLQQAAKDALRQWKYEPARLDGQPVAIHLSVVMKFRIP
jgi:protein TonB